MKYTSPATRGWRGYFQFTLTLICGTTTPAVSFTQNSSFLKTHTVELVSGQTTKDLTAFAISDFTLSPNCPITNYEIDNNKDKNDNINAPAGVRFATSCAQSPCRTVNVDAVTEIVHTYSIFITALPTSQVNTFHSDLVTVNVICGDLSTTTTNAVTNPVGGSS